MTVPADIEIAHGPRPGLARAIVRLHEDYYGREWGLGAVFKGIVSEGVREFMPRCDTGNSRIFHASRDGRLIGTLTLDAGEPGTGADACHLRWFILADAARGQGIGAALMGKAMTFMAERRITRCWLTTFAGLEAARRLYESHGFRLIASSAGATWGRELEEQRFEWRNPDGS